MQLYGEERAITWLPRLPNELHSSLTWSSTSFVYVTSYACTHNIVPRRRSSLALWDNVIER